MGPLLRIPVIRSLHDRQLLFPVVVVLVVSGVLVQGAWQSGDRSAETAGQEDTPAPVPSPVSRRPDLEKTPLTYFDDYWRQLRERVEDKVVLVGPNRTPAVVVMPGLALTSAEAGDAVLAEIERARLMRPPDEPSASGGRWMPQRSWLCRPVRAERRRRSTPASTVGSVYLSHRLSPFSIYTLKLHRRGISYPGREEAERATQRMAATRASATSTGPQ